MKKLSIVSASLFLLTVSQAQDDSSHFVKKQIPSLATVRTIGYGTIKGWIYEVNDSQVVLVNSVKKLSQPFATRQAIPIEDIRLASFRKKNSALRGALIGLGIGGLTGIVMGLVSGDDPVYTGPVDDPITALVVSFSNSFAMTAGEKAAFGGLALGGTGAIIGTIVGAVAKKRFIIGGRKKYHRDLQEELMNRLVTQ
jgi:hypothetical protein